ncbi:MAG: aminopeptidase P N-terminal domain-containing protein [Gammaproteobacteria bacterium]|nr:aminopeptidase P N-terminal domain-containing protein [Gammaproteobacteria bacterium]MCY4219948.1 aminopeptidase P N-terminal domain-containing protein [Gammaproteobacteria bacterium]
MLNNTALTKRRAEFMGMLCDGIAILTTSKHLTRNRDVFYPFRPDSDFFYLTAFPEPNAAAVFVPGRDKGEYLLFCREKDPEMERWDGRRAGLEGAIEQYGADQAFPIEKLQEVLIELIPEYHNVYSQMGKDSDLDKEILSIISDLRTKSREGTKVPANFVHLDHILHEMRLIKDSEEIRTMRKAAKLAAKGHIRAMQTTRPGMYEYQVQAELEYVFLKGGGLSVAYPSIVAGGPNACILHYIDNNDRLNDGDLLLIDAGVEVDCYASDITRTFPVNGKFTGAQRDVYDVVLNAQVAAIDAVRVDRPVTDYHEVAVRTLAEGMIDIGLLRGDLEELIEKKTYRKFYMHLTGHWLGIDVHDVGDYKIGKQGRSLEPGMIVTVEPGLYIEPCKEVDEKWHNIGIRIEDDVLVRRNGPEVLTVDVPKNTDEIQAIMAD